MKTEWKRYAKPILFVLLTLLVTWGLILAVDVGLDGQVADLFEQLFIRKVREVYTRVDGSHQIIGGIFLQWNRLKLFLVGLILVLAFFWSVSLIAALAFSEKRLTKAAVNKSTQLVQAVFAHNGQDPLLIPKEYAPIAQCAQELRKQMQRQEQDLQREAAQKTDLIAYLAHDLKTPLTSVIGYLSLLEEVPEMPTEQRAKYTHISLEKALRLEKLINELFEITRYNLHQVLLDPETFSLSYMLEQLTDEFYPQLEQHRNSLVLTVPPALTLTADPDKLARVFSNLLKNAIAYSDPGSPITIEATQSREQTVIRFSNRGRTIPKHKLETIFDKFCRLDDARSTNTGGAGLGLAIAREILEAHGGTVTASSENRQTTFTVTLPTGEEAAHG